MTTRRAWLAVSALVALGLCTGSAAAERAAPVYEALFAYLGQFVEPGHVFLVLERPLDPSSTLSLVELKASGLPRRLAVQPRSAFGSSRVRLLSNTEYLQIFADERGCAGGWKELHLRYPGAKALVEVSGVSIDKAGRTALVLVGIGSACFGSTVSMARFALKGGAWEFASLTRISIS